MLTEYVHMRCPHVWLLHLAHGLISSQLSLGHLRHAALGSQMHCRLYLYSAKHAGMPVYMHPWLTHQTISFPAM